MSALIFTDYNTYWVKNIFEGFNLSEVVTITLVFQNHVSFFTTLKNVLRKTQFVQRGMGTALTEIQAYIYIKFTKETNTKKQTVTTDSKTKL
jgi:hypothetical protein